MPTPSTPPSSFDPKFTPGPWVAETNKKSASVSIYGVRGDGNNRQSDGRGRLVTVECATDPDAVMFSPMDAEQVANANLIAAAPDLYEALERLTKSNPHGSPEEYLHAVYLGMGALRKARGEQP